MKTFETPKFEIILLTSADIVTTSRDEEVNPNFPNI